MNAGGRIRPRRWTGLAGLLLPLTVLVLLPILVTQGDRHLVVVPLGPFRWLGLVPICLGATVAVWSAVLLSTRGEGTPAPWDPPQKFVLAGPYQYVRNPMMLGAFAVLLGEAVWAESLAILLYLCLVMGVVWLYVVTIEEKGLEVRFHDVYLVYKERVPRWLPRLSRSPHA
ncbi:MAG: isoprenylcysteine carboxylmethyltransferase family protein [Candidatus Methylomirabilales bacterium]|nr:isoprenylcysteine carboxylmethyltransferase family protein [candidate division NC10 bacterium]